MLLIVLMVVYVSRSGAITGQRLSVRKGGKERLSVLRCPEKSDTRNIGISHAFARFCQIPEFLRVNKSSRCYIDVDRHETP